MLATIEQLGLIENVSPIQYAIRLLIPAGSRLLELPEVKNGVGDFDLAALSYPWQHPYPAMDELYKRVYRLVQLNSRGSRPALFARIWQEVLDIAPGLETAPQFARQWDSLDAPVPQLSESWY
jgi:hypothetical protein